jgi:hypothetical protein
MVGVGWRCLVVSLRKISCNIVNRIGIFEVTGFLHPIKSIPSSGIYNRHQQRSFN